MSRPKVVVCVAFQPDQLEIFQQHFDVVYAPNPEALGDALIQHGADIRGAITTGAQGFKGSDMERLPGLEIVAIRGAGTENVDLETARRRGIAVSNCPGINYFAVAEHAVALLLSVVRRIPFDNAGIHNGEWQALKTAPLRPLIYRKRLGILGLGTIGKAIAERVQGFEMDIRYHNRTPRSDVTYPYVGSVLELAQQSDILVISAPGGRDTHGLVSASVLEALGPSGFVVNVGRGSIIDQRALIDRLMRGQLAGAALDVIDGEPDIPPEMLAAPNLILTPHIAGGSPESRYAAIAAVCASLAAKFQGAPIPHQIV